MKPRGRDVATLLLLAATPHGSPRAPEEVALRTACEGAREPLPQALFFQLDNGAFDDDPGRPDVAVHVPPGFDATRRPGLVLYFHGWNGCVAQALADDEAPCSEGGDARAAAQLAAQLDDTRANALLVAVELRADMQTGEPGALAMPGGLRAMLRELLGEKLAPVVGCAIDVDALDRTVIVAHSGGYQAAASALEFGDVPSIRELDMLDALYGAESVVGEWLRYAVDRTRFVNLYTCCGGTLERSRAMARFARATMSAAGLGDAVYDDDGEDDLDDAALSHPIVFKRVPIAHRDLPRAYVRSLIAAAGFSRIDTTR